MEKSFETPPRPLCVHTEGKKAMSTIRGLCSRGTKRDRRPGGAGGGTRSDCNAAEPNASEPVPSSAARRAASDHDDAATDAATANPRRKRRRTGKGAGAGAGANAHSNAAGPCAICLLPAVATDDGDNETNEGMPACGHRFHAECVLALQRSGVHTLCPLCRAAIPASASTMVDDAWTLAARANFGKADEVTFRLLQHAVVAKLRDAVAIAGDPEGHSRALNDLARMLMAQGEYISAEPLLRRSLALQKKEHGDTPHQNVAAAMNNLANVIAEQGKFSEAERLYKEALAIAKQSHGGGDAPHEAVSAGMGNLAVVLCGLKRYAEAEQLQRQALEIDRKVHGDVHPSVAMDLSNLAKILGRNVSAGAEAARLGKQALSIFETTLGPEHPWSQSCRMDWG